MAPPVEMFDADGAVVYEYRAAVECDDLAELLQPPVDGRETVRQPSA